MALLTCRAIYESLPLEKIIPAVAMLRAEIPEEDKAEIRTNIAASPQTWFAPVHFLWGMQIRNLLRDRGFGEAYFDIISLDDIYVELIEDAVGGLA